MPKFVVTQRSFINNALQEPGAEVEYDPGKGCDVAENLELRTSSSKAAEASAGKED